MKGILGFAREQNPRKTSDYWRESRGGKIGENMWLTLVPPGSICAQETTALLRVD